MSDSPIPPPGPLDGLRVIDLTHHLAGPTCTLLLADMGADVIKIERPPDGEDTRRESTSYQVNGVSAPFMMMNRNKRSLALDLKYDSGRRVLGRLLADADVVAENFRGGVMDRLGLGYEALHARFPRLVYTAISGFGRTGPDAERGGFDLIAQGVSGLMRITGEGPGRAPVKVGAPVTDVTAGILAAMGTLAALHARTTTGRGQMVDTSLLEAGITHTFWHSTIAFITGAAPGPMGSAHPLNAPYQAFETEDDWITVGAANQANWLRLLEVLEAPELGADPRFAENAARMENLDALAEALNARLRRRSSAAWLERLAAAGVPAGPINTVEAMHTDRQVRARGMVREVEHPVAGRVETLGPPVKFTETPASVRRPAPLLGEHSREVLAAHGFAEAEIAALAAEGAVLLAGE